MGTRIITFEEVLAAVRDVVGSIMAQRPAVDAVVGVSRGGIYPAVQVHSMLESLQQRSLMFRIVDPFTADWMDEFRGDRVAVIDDIWDSGATLTFFEDVAKEKQLDLKTYALFVKTEEEKAEGTWYWFPWETCSDVGDKGRRQGVVALLRSIGEDPLREGLLNTPTRVARMWDELACGYQENPEKILDTTFTAQTYDEMVVLKDIRFYSMCEHHMLPFYGVVHFAYIPDKKIVGVSKVARLVNCFARRLQIQERMTMQIGQTFERVVEPLGVGVVVEGTHLCMMIRGVNKENATMVTSYMGGAFRKQLSTRDEFLSFISRGGK
jgi:GTP cyclohydrolase I